MLLEEERFELIDTSDQSSYQFSNDVIEGFSKDRKTLSPKYLYDKRGSEIFEMITDLEEYYPSRTETAILNSFSPDMASWIGPEALLIEPGSGSGEKVRDLLPFLIRPVAYVPVEISKEILIRMSEELTLEFPEVPIRPVCADFTRPFHLPQLPSVRKSVVFFPGSTVGNFDPSGAIELLKSFGDLVGKDGGLLIGVDLKKDPAVLELAYDDPKGVTASFNLNLLKRLNRELSATFDLRKFKHIALYNKSAGRVEMHLVSKCAQIVKVSGKEFHFKEGETIHTESSYKYSVEEFITLAAHAKFKIRNYWKDSGDLFCVYYFERESI